MLKKIGLFLLVLIIAGSVLSACRGPATDKENQDLLAGFNVKARQFINQPGWVHVTEKIIYDTDKQDRGKLANGTVVPLVQTVDSWYHINESKLVYEYVWFMTAQDGEPITTMVFLNNNLYNLTSNLSNPLNPYHLGALDYEFADEMDQFILNGKHPIVNASELNEKTTSVFTLEEKLDSPRTIDEYSQPVVATGTIATYDTESGLLLMLQRTVSFADGSKRTFYTTRMSSATGVQPTEEVQLYVNGFW